VIVTVGDVLEVGIELEEGKFLFPLIEDTDSVEVESVLCVCCVR
jgi:hypothetical protein